MKILVLADNFIPEIVATSFRTMDHAQVWLQQGHDVTVVTCVPNSPHGKVFDGYKNRLYQEEWIDGVRVIRLWSYMTANKGFFKRTLDYLSFMAMAIAFCWRFPKFDVVLATSPQFFTAVAGWVVSLLRRRPWIFEVRDLWPDSIKAVGASDGWIIRSLEKLELFLYRHATRIIVVTHAFQQNLMGRSIAAEKIDVITNGVDCQRFSRNHVTIDARKKLGIPADSFLAGYIGTTGMAHGLETIVAAAKCCQSNDRIRILIMGDGAERRQLEEKAKAMGVNNIHFANRVPHDEVASYYAALDLAIVHLKPDPVFKTVIPSKIFELMAMEIPILMAGEGEAGDIITVACCGVCIPSGDAINLAETVLQLVDGGEALSAMGKRGRAVAQAEYSRLEKGKAVAVSLTKAIDTWHGKPVVENSMEQASAAFQNSRKVA